MDQSIGALFQQKCVWTHGFEIPSEVSPQAGVGPWMATESFWAATSLNKAFSNPLTRSDPGP